MTGGNYARHFKVLGKLAKLYDVAAADESTLETLLSTFADQVATGGVASLPAVLQMGTYISRWNSAIDAGATALQRVAQDAAKAYLRSDDFIGDLTTVPDTNSIEDVLAALQTEIGAGVDNVTLGTLAATGLVHFFDSMLAAAGTWNTEADATADYRDAIYVVSAVV